VEEQDQKIPTPLPQNCQKKLLEIKTKKKGEKFETIMSINRYDFRRS